MRALNRGKGIVAGIAPGEVGEVDPENSGIKVFVEAGLLVDESTIESPPEREPTLEEAKRAVDELASRLADARDQLSDAKLKHGEVVLERDALHARITELEAQNKQLAAVAETNANELKKAHDANGKLAARITELEAQLAAKAESTPTAEPAKKGKG